MASDLVETRAYRHTIDRLEAVKRVSSQGTDYWLAREIHLVLGYPVWDNFLPVIDRARDSFDAAGGESSHHIVLTHNMMGLGKGGRRQGVDYFLSRGACYLIAMNGDPSKPEVAAAQAYFAIQTRAAELNEQETRDRKRLAVRERVTKAHKRVSDVAKDAGVERHALFNNARYEGLYGATSRQVRRAKGLGDTENLLNYAAPLELSAHEFQMNLAAEKLLNEGISGEAKAIAANLEVAKGVRQTIIDNVGTPPEKLPLEREPIQAVKKRIAARDKTQGRIAGD